MKELKTLNDLHQVFCEKQDTTLKDQDLICRKEGCSKDYLIGFVNGLQFAKIMTSLTEGFELI